MGHEHDLYKKYLENPHKMLFHFGFVDDIKKMSISMSFLHNIASKFIEGLSKTADLEFTRENTVLTPSKDEILNILHSVPYVVGLKFINVNLQYYWKKQLSKKCRVCLKMQISRAVVFLTIKMFSNYSVCELRY